MYQLAMVLTLRLITLVQLLPHVSATCKGACVRQTTQQHCLARLVATMARWAANDWLAWCRPPISEICPCHPREADAGGRARAWRGGVPPLEAANHKEARHVHMSKQSISFGTDLNMCPATACFRGPLSSRHANGLAGV